MAPPVTHAQNECNSTDPVGHPGVGSVCCVQFNRFACHRFPTRTRRIPRAHAGNRRPRARRIRGDTGNLSRFARRRFPTCPCQIPDADAGNRHPRARCIRRRRRKPQPFLPAPTTPIAGSVVRNSHWYRQQWSQPNRRRSPPLPRQSRQSLRWGPVLVTPPRSSRSSLRMVSKSHQANCWQPGGPHS